MIPSHPKDTRHLIAILRTINLPPQCTLFILDVESLYTKVPINEGIECVASLIRAHPDLSRPDNTLLTLLKLILTSNVFGYEGFFFSQCHGVAMGQVFGGSFANLFLSHWEKIPLTDRLKPSRTLGFAFKMTFLACGLSMSRFCTPLLTILIHVTPR